MCDHSKGDGIHGKCDVFLIIRERGCKSKREGEIKKANETKMGELMSNTIAGTHRRNRRGCSVHLLGERKRTRCPGMDRRMEVSHQRSLKHNQIHRMSVEFCFLLSYLFVGR